MNSQDNSLFWQLITEFNVLMKSAIEGPNCINPNVCMGDCCSIKIDIPKVLAKEYIKRGYAYEDDFIRSNIFAFQLRFNENSGKCFFFDPKLNGCSIHNSGIKPVQCWIYPTGFSNNSQKEISCKKLSGWKIKDLQKTEKAEKILKKYIFLCNLEARKELKEIQSRITSKKQYNGKSFSLMDKFRAIKPCELAGITDKWDYIDVLLAEGFSLQMKKFCLKFNPDCSLLPDKYFECESICKPISEKLNNYIFYSLYEFIKINGQTPDGEYSLINLFKFKELDYVNI